VDLPSGVVTFLMTDIEGSTRLWGEAPEAMRAALARHNAICTSVVGEHGGFIVKSRGEGDSTFSVFGRPTDAVAAACALQTALTGEMWPESARLGVRVAVHTGEADLGVDDYYGIAVSRCARLRSIAHGGQVLVSEATAGLVRELLPEEVAFRDLGHQRLRDLAEPERVSQLLHPSLPTDFPALRTIDSIPNNLPYQVSAFIGRDSEITRIREFLRETRLLTLTGAGGIGKTRLAVQAAAEMLYEYPDGVWLAELGSLADGGLLHQTLATVLEVREEPGRPLSDTMVAHLRSKQALLVIDGCEHLVGAAAKMAEGLLRRCPGLKIMATSRETLRAEGETAWRVPSLAVPLRRLGVELQPEQLTRYAAVRLFIDRARKADPCFAVTNDNAAAVADICSRLDGVPLAIELAAARTNILTPKQVEQRLDERFRLLTGGRRTALARQQTLEAAVRWSYELLPEIEQRLFARLSVFAGGFTLEAVEAVCSGEGVDAAEIAGLVSELAAKSLVIPGVERHWMLETVRAYARQRLRESREEDPLSRRGLEFLASLGETAKPGTQGPEQAAWFALLDQELANVRAALEWGAEHHPEAGARLADSMCLYWEVRGYMTEGRTWLQRYIARGHALPSDLLVPLMLAAGHLAYRQGDLADAADLCDASLALAREQREPRREAQALTALGNVLCDLGEYSRAIALQEESLQRLRALGDLRGTAAALHNLARVTSATGDVTRARAYYEESLATKHALGDRRFSALTEHNLAICLRTQGDHDGARELLEGTLEALRELADRTGQAYCLNALSNTAVDQGDLDSAQRFCEEGLAVIGEIGLARMEPRLRCRLGVLAFLRGDAAMARELIESVLRDARARGDREITSLSLGELAKIASTEERHDEALALAHEGVTAIRETGDVAETAGALCVLGGAALAAGDLPAAEQALREGLALARQSGGGLLVVDLLEAIAGVWHGRGERSTAARVLGAAQRERRRMGTPALGNARGCQHRLLRGLHDALGQETLAQVLAEGEDLTVEEAVALALSEAGAS